MSHIVKIIEKQPLTHDVIRFRLSRPEGYNFVAGQAIELQLEERPGQTAPFTFTGLNTKPYLELMTKIYPSHNGMTLALSKKNVGDHVIISDPWDSYINHGSGVFIAGGAGITPFVAMLRQLHVDKAVAGAQLFFSNKTEQDVFLADEFRQMLGNGFVSVITRDGQGSGAQRIDLPFLKRHVTDKNKPFYVCGPPGFVEDMQKHLAGLGVTQESVGISL